MNTLSAFMMGYANGHKDPMVFDWDKAAQIISERGAKEAHAGLKGDWKLTGGCILRDGRPVRDSYTYLSSTWATPALRIGSDEIECFRMKKDCEWDHGTKWPKSALSILGVKGADRRVRSL